MDQVFSIDTGRGQQGEKKRKNMCSASVSPKLMSFYLLENITNGFSEDRKLGAGSYGKVYMGEYEDGEAIAVKLLHYTPGLDDEQFEKEYRNLASLQHNNIVRLLGYAHETQRECLPYNGKMVFAEMTKRALCFEYMPNGSLDKFLSDESSGLDWCTRYSIIKGICEGIQYLHGELDSPMYHLDLKPANVLLDENMVPKVADFGLSRLFGGELTQMTKSAIGTPGYVPPEYIDAAIISIKFDIFSLGVVIIKIMTGPTGYFRTAEMSCEQFIELVHENWNNRLHTTSLYKSYSEQAKRCIEIALRCVDADRHKRPSMGVIMDQLNETETAIQLLEVSWNDTGSYEMCHCISTECELMDISLKKCVSHPMHVTDNRGEVHEVTVTTAYDPASETETFEPIRPRIKMIDMRWHKSGFINVMDVHPAKPWILLGHISGKVSLWNHRTQENVMKWDASEDGNKGYPISAVKFIARMNWFVIGTAIIGLIQVYSCNKVLGILNQFTAGYGRVNSLAVHPSQPLVLSACGRQIKLWNWEAGWACIRTFAEAHSGDVLHQYIGAEFNPQGTGDTFASASWDGTVQIWSIYSDTPISTLKSDYKQRLLQSVDYFIARGDRQYIVAGYWDGTAHSNKCIRRIKGLQTWDNNIAVAVVGRPQGHQILVTVSKDNVVSFCDSTTHRYENKVHFTNKPIRRFGYINSTKSLVIGYIDGLAIIETMK
ncbi:receptor-like serine/threonine-protein kinase ALE2 isoform X2 [Triticum aestivum]|uniref:receptor-like serine/threonine-protein kinase ALE2 isoform X2 n=1 Tax=Triticum aestivum TaxID=4565 RepID=UPI001D02E67F|nr:receptor-like serine/threonine-protein kinase ALE2 isoform X2 [Triticum aestivum]